MRLCVVGTLCVLACLLHSCVCQDDTDAQFYDIFDSDFFEWRLAFRGESGVKTSVYGAYTTQMAGTVEPGCMQFKNPNMTCSHHYRNNDVFDNWKDVDQVALVVYRGGNRVANVVFDGSSSDVINWFDQSKIVSSSWIDIKTVGKNFFSVIGHHDLNRHFFMEHQYGGCPNDMGWFVAIDMVNPPCTWENNPCKHQWPCFLYTLNNKIANWNKPQDVGIADSFGIFVKYKRAGAIGK